MLFLISMLYGGLLAILALILILMAAIEINGGIAVPALLA